MKKLFAALALCLSTLLFSTPITDHKIDLIALNQLIAQLGLPTNGDIVAETQKHWLRKPGQERWEQAELSPEQRQFVLKWATEQGLYAAWKPSLQTYDKALILGATTSRMQGRLNDLAQLWNDGIRFHEIVWLTGDRPLDARVDALTDRCQNESEAARMIWEESSLPAEMRALPVVFVAVPMNGQKRPNTEDTIIAWLNKSSEPCTALFVSDQPFCGYQFEVIKSRLPKEILFDVVGRGAEPASHPAAAAITLDSLARWLYQERQNASQFD